jgi:hypothetical protein
LKSTDLLAAIDGYLRPYVIAEAGKFAIAADPDSALEMLSGDAPKRWRCVLVFDGYQGIQSNESYDGFVDAKIAVYVQLPGGLTNKPTSELFKPTLASPAMLSRIELVILLLRRLALRGYGIADCRGLRFQGSQWVASHHGAAMLHTHRLDFLISICLDDAAADVVVDVNNVQQLREDGGAELEEDGGQSERETP